MLGLGSTLVNDSFVGGLIPITATAGSLYIDENDDDNVLVQIVYNIIGSNLQNLLSPSSPSIGNRLTGVSWSLKVERYDDYIIDGGTVQAQASAEVFFYFNASPAPFVGYFISTVEASPSLAPSTFQSGGSSRIDLSSYGSPATDLTASGTNLYVFTLTGQKDGYEDFVVSTDEISIPEA
ncbi:MAG: hypothetical protein NWE77_06725 [Candidatus Bathyarchaeota archaeon]|nr:hypothetical protein [Candidatus Bathyarchaeota archaeon]